MRSRSKEEKKEQQNEEEGQGGGASRQGQWHAMWFCPPIDR